MGLYCACGVDCSDMENISISCLTSVALTARRKKEKH